MSTSRRPPDSGLLGGWADHPLNWQVQDREIVLTPGLATRLHSARTGIAIGFISSCRFITDARRDMPMAGASRSVAASCGF
jgi:hypothetical protein